MSNLKGVTTVSIELSHLRRYALALCSCLVCACAPVPLAYNHWLDPQPKTRSVKHWKLLADQMAKSMDRDLRAANGSIVLRPALTRSRFTDAFEAYLTTKLVEQCRGPRSSKHCTVAQGHEFPAKCDQGLQCDNSPEALTYITYGVQKVIHRDGETGRSPPGVFTLLGAGVWLGRQADRHWGATDRYVAAIPTGALLDLLEGTVATPTHTEVILSVAFVGPDGTAEARCDQSFYVEDADSDEYPNEPLYVSNGAPASVQWKSISIHREDP